MQYYTMKMREGKNGVDNPQIVTDFIKNTNCIGVGEKKSTKGYGTFCAMQSGDIVLVRAGGSPLVLVQVLSEPIPYNAEGKNPLFDGWLVTVRKIKVLSWYKEDNERYSIPRFSGSSYISTCAKVNKDNSKKIISQWMEIVMKHSSKEKEEAFLQKVKDSLEKTKNVILTGAPGTGKTYLAKQIAYALTGDDEKNSPHIEFCQFHPSFDYTDFVEGLRPVDKGNGNIGFERKDGIFKAFCKKALGKSVNNFDEAYSKFADYLSENHNRENALELKTPNNASFRVFLNSKGSLSLLTGQKDEVQGSLTPEKIKTFLTENPYEYWAGYYLGVIEYLKKNFNLLSTSDKDEQKYVFIIDEINRGDISKIFGELFYAVDPGYRGEKGKVKTQDSNLLSQDDPYYAGFFIPENVYIIGTMNDIDRSVESMDFAIRRRFTWKEIKAQDRIDMWDGKIDQWKADAGKRMNALNAAISQTESLSDAFHIGPAYFLKLSEKGYNFETLWDLHIKPLLKEYLRGTVNPENDLARLQDAYNLKFIEKTLETAEQPATESQG